MSDHDHHDHSHAPVPQDAGSQALAEALRSSFTIVKIAMAALVVLILADGFFQVKPGEKAVILRFGKPVGEGQNMLLGPGKLHWSLPYPIDEVIRIPIAERQTVTSSVGWYAMTHAEEVAFETLGIEPPPPRQSLDPAVNGYVITADRNIIHARATVTYHIEDPLAAIFNFTAGTNHEFDIAGISNALQNAANNALVATAARFNVDDILTRDRAGFQAAVEQHVIDLAEREHLGVSIDLGQVQVWSEAPRQLADIFKLVTDARLNRDKLMSEALGDQSRILSQAGAMAVSITNAAETARFNYVKSVQSDAAAFTQLLPQYEHDPRLYAQLELAKAMPQILTNVEKIYMPQRADGKARELRLMLNREPLGPKSGANP
jgi:membrane protease subunit HflK